ncbi:hypothetical protein SCHPADRAFT_873022 [Schizopora paradoxa]|uniref:Mitochondrial ATP synthase epsilon chain domain-containing protein n=1 Tax=Schizopora paradoxa TaxID=27342 RepID=A0A0H2RXI5_9AGAM|nr:hypothetical protein SCHPADRAFT_873022 [Schizopora paradoxa]
MSSATWRQFFSFNKYSQITARAVRQSLKETERAAAEKRGLTALRYQNWENGKGGEQVYLNPPETPVGKGTPAV